jgi:hypothetical protein
MVLAVTEAFAGSDVAGLRTTAVKTPDGKHYIVNGTKYATYLPHIPCAATITNQRQEMDHKRYLCRLLCNRLPHREGLLRPSDPPRRGHRDHPDQDILLNSRGNGIRRVQQRQGPR